MSDDKYTSMNAAALRSEARGRGLAQGAAVNQIPLNTLRDMLRQDDRDRGSKGGEVNGTPPAEDAPATPPEAQEKAPDSDGAEEAEQAVRSALKAQEVRQAREQAVRANALAVISDCALGLALLVAVVELIPEGRRMPIHTQALETGRQALTGIHHIAEYVG